MKAAPSTHILRNADGLPFGFFLQGGSGEHLRGISGIAEKLGIAGGGSVAANTASGPMLDEARKALKFSTASETPTLRPLWAFEVHNNFRPVRRNVRSLAAGKLMSEPFLSLKKADFDAVSASSVWDQDGFIILTSDSVAGRLLRCMFDAAARDGSDRIAVWLGTDKPGNPFAQAGLVVALSSLARHHFDAK